MDSFISQGEGGAERNDGDGDGVMMGGEGGGGIPVGWQTAMDSDTGVCISDMYVYTFVYMYMYTYVCMYTYMCMYVICICRQR